MFRKSRVIRILFLIAGVGGLILGFQNCSQSQFYSNDDGLNTSEGLFSLEGGTGADTVCADENCSTGRDELEETGNPNTVTNPPTTGDSNTVINPPSNQTPPATNPELAPLPPQPPVTNLTVFNVKRSSQYDCQRVVSELTGISLECGLARDCQGSCSPYRKDCVITDYKADYGACVLVALGSDKNKGLVPVPYNFVAHTEDSCRRMVTSSVGSKFADKCKIGGSCDGRYPEWGACLTIYKNASQ